MTQFPYDTERDPPTPAVTFRLGRPGMDDLTYTLMAFIDTGADSTVVPREVADRLRLPRIGEVILTGVGGFKQRAAIHAARIDVAGFETRVEVIASGDVGLVGRDLLNQWTVILRGPRRVMEIDVSADGG